MDKKQRIKKLFKKKYLIKHLFYVVFITTFCVACSKKSNNKNNSKIVGTWQFKNMYQSNGIYKEDGLQNGTYFAYTENQVGDIILNNDDSYSLNIGYDFFFKSIVNGINIDQQSNVPQQLQNSTYVYNSVNNKITFMSGDLKGTFDLEILNNNQLKLSKYEKNESQQQGKKVENSCNTTYEFIKK